APVEGQPEPHHEEEAEEVERELVQEVEGPLEELEAQPEWKPERDVVVDRRQDGPEEQHAEPPEHEGVHHPGVALRQDPALEQAVAQEESQALRDAVEALLGLPLAPERHALPHAEQEHADRDDRERVEEKLSPFRYVPERVAERNIGEAYRGGTHAG